MQKELFNSFNELGQAAYEATLRMGEVNLRAGEKLLAQQLELTGSLLETGSKNLELMSQARTPQDVLNNQARLMQDCGQQWLTTCRSTVEILAEARDATGELVEEQVKAAGEKVKEAARKTV